MSDEPNIELAYFRAILRFASVRFDAAAKKIAWHMQRQPSKGARHGWRAKTLWDDQCIRIDQGPFEDELEWNVERELIPLLDSWIESVPENERSLLSVAIADPFDQPAISKDGFFGWDREALRERLKTALVDLSRERDIDRLRDTAEEEMRW